MKQAILICLALLASIAGASARTQIDHQYKRWAKATLTNDVDTVLSVLAPGYTLHTYTGTVIERKAYEASLRKRKASKQPATAYQTQIASVSVAGSTARVISDETSAKVSVDPVTSKKLKMIHIHRYLDTWVKLGTVWKLQSTVTQLESTKIVDLGGPAP